MSHAPCNVRQVRWGTFLAYIFADLSDLRQHDVVTVNKVQSMNRHNQFAQDGEHKKKNTLVLRISSIDRRVLTYELRER